MSRTPIRMRVAAAFALAMVIVLAGAGAQIYSRVGDDLAHALDQDLRLRAQDVSALVTAGGSLSTKSSSRLIESGESFAQLLDQRGSVLDTTRTLGTRPLLVPAQITAAQRGNRFFDRGSVPGLDEPSRLFTLPVSRSGQRLVLVI